MSPSRRFADWAARLDWYLAANRDRPFSYDSKLGLDCCTFTFGAIEAMTGIPIDEQFAGTYSTKRGSLRAMEAYCGRASLRVFIWVLMNEFGFERTTYAFACRGDAVIVPELNFFGILGLNGRDVIGVRENGLGRVAISPACVAWRIA